MKLLTTEICSEWYKVHNVLKNLLKECSKVKILKKAVLIAPKEETKKERKSHKENTLPPEDYKDEIEPLELQIDEGIKLVFSVKRGGEYGLPRVDVRQWVDTENYSGPTKKGINFPLEFLIDFIEKCNDVAEECDKADLEQLVGKGL